MKVTNAMVVYEVINNYGLFFIERKMDLEGRVNLIFEEVSPTSTRITANTKYVVSLSIIARSAANNIPHSDGASISFNSGVAHHSRPPPDGSRATECVLTGRLERDILSSIR